MIIIQARIPVNSERRNVAYQRIHEFVDAARAESGCLNCDAFISLENPDSVLIHQSWRDVDDLDRHAKGEALDAFLGALPEFVDGQVTTSRYDTMAGVTENLEDDEDSDLMDVEAAPGANAPLGVTLH